MLEARIHHASLFTPVDAAHTSSGGNDVHLCRVMAAPRVSLEKLVYRACVSDATLDETQKYEYFVITFYKILPTIP